MLVLFVAPYFSENAKLYLDRTASVPGARLAVITQDDPDQLPHDLRSRLARVVRVDDALAADALVAAAEEISRALGPIHRMLGIVEQLQVPLAEARERLGVVGMSAERARNFRDKTRMKELLRAADVPVARFKLVDTTEAALRFADEVGLHLVVKPPAGAASQATYRVHDEASLRRALTPTSVAAGGVALIEELVTGEEHSFDAFVQNGRVVFYSVSDYRPSCLEVMQNPWMQWVVVLPREHESADVARTGARALEVLGLETGMCHLEWFRRADGSLVISEVGARPPGAQIPTLISRAHDIDCVGVWARLVATGEIDPVPPRKYASGAAYLRGQGEGRVRAVHGIDRIERDLGELVTDARLPRHGQEKAPSYEGEGFVVVRHPDTKVVEDALKHIVSTVRVELG